MAHELTGATVLLKGAITIVVGTDEEKRSRVILSGRAPAWLSTAGAGDVLAGMLGALLAQQGDLLADEPAHLHGLAAATASESEQRGWNRPELAGRGKQQRFSSLGHPIIATDVIASIPQAFDELIR